MSRASFEQFGDRATRLSSDTLIAGRHAFQRAEESNILPDVLTKLDLRPTDHLLDIGCNTGNLLIPLSFYVETVTGVDHPACIERLRKRTLGLGNVRLIGGNFLDAPVEGTFDKIAVYSVIHYLRSPDEAVQFLAKALGLLKPRGKMLVADVPNTDKSERFARSGFGARFQEEWARRVQEHYGRGDVARLEPMSDPELIRLDDRAILGIVSEFRSRGFDVYLLPQKDGLPFNHTRDDLLFEKP